MSDIWVISDQHYNHNNIVKFLRHDGTPLRPFNDIEEMNETLITNHNSVVKPQDKVYHLGDFCMGYSLPENICRRLNGKHRLVRGNHDMCPTEEYMAYFDEIFGCRVFHKEHIIMSHIPIHKDSLMKGGNRWLNVHGHLHYKSLNDPQYFCASVEQINYTPIHLDELVKIAKKL